MVYGYIRVSTDRQTVENQRFEILRFCKKNSLEVELGLRRQSAERSRRTNASWAGFFRTFAKTT